MIFWWKFTSHLAVWLIQYLAQYMHFPNVCMSCWFLQNVRPIWFMVKWLNFSVWFHWHFHCMAQSGSPQGSAGLAGVSIGVQEKPGLGEFSFSVCVGQSQHGITHLLGPCVHDVCHRYPTLLWPKRDVYCQLKFRIFKIFLKCFWKKSLGAHKGYIYSITLQ